ncbi:hypothetical protein [Crateriforma spongiae]|uniref:hypothetical protein n=1 Tax=Crateriforma spongiae TaxID=2724528 RepID=UPI001F254EE7|nr:hypothetical protein [Crateriforma spongiae]
MWNAYAVTLAGTSILALLLLSAIFSTRETIVGLRDLFDIRILRRAFRDGRRFRISTMLWLTGFIAISIAVFQTFERSPLPYLIVPFLVVMLLLIRVAIHTVVDPRIRRLPHNPDFSGLVDALKGRDDCG